MFTLQGDEQLLIGKKNNTRLVTRFARPVKRYEPLSIGFSSMINPRRACAARVRVRDQHIIPFFSPIILFFHSTTMNPLFSRIHPIIPHYSTEILKI